MDNPLENKEFKFYLNFRDEELGFGKNEITEPIGFDASSFNVLQDSDRYGRDVEYSNAEVELDFQRYYATQMNGNVNQLLDGLAVNRLSMGLEYLIEAYKLKGFEADVQFILERNNLEFTAGVLDFAQSETDLKTYFKCKIIQDTDKALFKRRSELKVDLLSSEDLDGNYVEPVQTHNILLKPIPLLQQSKWGRAYTVITTIILNQNPLSLLIPLGSQLETGEIRDSYITFDWFSRGWLEFESGDIHPSKVIDDCKILIAKDELTDVKIDIKNVIIRANGVEFLEDENRMDFVLVYIPPDAFDSAEYDYHYLEDPVWELSVEGKDYSVNIPKIERGGKILVAVRYYYIGGGGAQVQYQTFVRYDSIEISTYATSFPSVTKGVRFIDLLKNTSNKTTGLNVYAPDYDIGGKFYDNFVFNGYMIRQFLDTNDEGETIEILKPINTTAKDVLEQLVELNEDWQILSNKTLFIGSYKNYYPNKEIGAFIQPSDKDFNVVYNERYLLQGFNYKYEDYEQDKDQDNTVYAVHTEAEFMIPNRQVETIKQIEVPYTRDPLSFESLRKENIVIKPTTSVNSDDKFFQLDVYPIPENTILEINNVLEYQASNETRQLKIIASDDMRWDLLGMKKGDYLHSLYFKVDDYVFSPIDGIYMIRIEKIEPSLLTLEVGDNIADPVFPTEILGRRIVSMSIEYYIPDVHLTNRTDEGFSFIDNVYTTTGFSNLNYTIRRNMRYWESYIRTASFYNQDKIFKNTYWKSNGELITQLVSESEAIKENESKPISELDLPVVTPIVYETTVVADYDQALSVIDKINTINPDGSIGGFIRIKTTEDKVVKGYVKKLEYNWGTNELNLTLEEKYEPEYISISNIGDGLIYINEAGYDDKIVKPLETKIVGNFVQLFDKSGIPLNNPTHYLKYKVNGIVYENVVNLSIAISEIW